MGFLKAMVDGEYGLAWMNVATYCDARRKGMGHSAALRRMIETRYKAGGSTSRDLLLRDLPNTGNAESDLKQVIGEMYALEVGVPSDFGLYSRRERYIDEAIAIHRRKHPQAFH